MNPDPRYDIAIIGGGLAGLALSIQSVRAGYHTVLFERERYPFHKVCGEYISLESWNFLEELGVPLSDMDIPVIRRLAISSPSGRMLEHELPLGGFGISRYQLDHMLALQAQREGVTLMEDCKVMDVLYRNNSFLIFTNKGEVESRVAAGAFGKRSNLDVKWKRNFIRQRPGKLNHYVAVKYHVRNPHPADLVALHNFNQGYCGISRVENDKCCLCYLTTAANLKSSRNDISLMEHRVLMQNPHLARIFRESEFLYEEPLAISRISFNKKSQVENHVLMIGDSAGMVTPLCGNGMSMALHASKLAFKEIQHFMTGQSNRFEMEQQYTQEWESHFSRRMQTGRFLQRFFGSALLSSMLLSGLKPFPPLINALIRQTHGSPF